MREVSVKTVALADGRLLRTVLAVVLVAACVVAVSGCHRTQGSDSAKGAASEFLIATAAGDAARAQLVSAKNVSGSDLRTLRKSLFKSDSPLAITDVRLVGGLQLVEGTDPVTYLVMDGYSVRGTALPSPDLRASATYQIGVEKRSGVWVVVSWTGPFGR